MLGHVSTSLHIAGRDSDARISRTSTKAAALIARWQRQEVHAQAQDIAAGTRWQPCAGFEPRNVG
jgi:hypothetical protein